MSTRVVTGLNHGLGSSGASSTRPLTLSERFAAIAAQAPVRSASSRSAYSASSALPSAAPTESRNGGQQETSVSGWPSASFPSRNAATSSSTSSSSSSLSSRFASTAATAPSLSAAAAQPSPPPVSLPPAASPPAATAPRARSIKLKGGQQLSVGASASEAKKQRQIKLQRETRLAVVQKKRLQITQPQRQQQQTAAAPSLSSSSALPPVAAVPPFSPFLPAPFTSPFTAALSSMTAPFVPGTVAPPAVFPAAAAGKGRVGVKNARGVAVNGLRALLQNNALTAAAAAGGGGRGKHRRSRNQ